MPASFAFPSGYDPNIYATANTTLAVDLFLASGTWTVPTGVTKAEYRAWGPGGGGTTNAGAGGGGACAQKNNVVVTPGAGITVTLGTVGAVGGGDATASSVGSDCIAKGGYGQAAGGGNAGKGGAAASCTGDTCYSGGDGLQGTGNRTGGAGAGTDGAGSGATPGGPQGGNGNSGATPVTNGAGGGSTGAAQFVGARGACSATYYAMATAGFPIVVGRTSNRDGSDQTSRSVSLPTVLGGIRAGDLIVVALGSDGIPTLGVTLYTAVGSQQNESSGECCLAHFKLIASGGETTCTVTTSSSEQANWRIWVFRGCPSGNVDVATATGNVSLADPPSLAPSWGTSAKCWWGASALLDGSAVGLLSGIPTNYGCGAVSQKAGTAGVNMYTAERFLQASSENPGTFNTSVEQWCSSTLAVKPG